MQKKLLAVLILFVASIFLIQYAEAKRINGIKNIIQSSPLNKTATISVSVKKATNGGDIFNYNENKLLHPASVQKILTFPAALNTLTQDYKFNTEFYSINKELYIKLGADPFLTTQDLKLAIKRMPKEQLKSIYVDDSVMDRYEWGVGWMWDDEMNPRMSKISPYNINQNLSILKIIPTTQQKEATIVKDENSYGSVVNLVTTDKKNNVIVHRQNAISPNMIYIYGTVKSPLSLKIPISNPEINFTNILNTTLKNKIITVPPVSKKIVPKNQKPLYVISHDIKPVAEKILQDSNNFYAETVFKLAGGKYAKSQATLNNSRKMFNEYYNKLGLDPSVITIADGSGVSRNNLFSANWISTALYKLQSDENFDYIKSNMSQPLVGTLKNRLPELENQLYVKTGTLSNISTITGYLTTKGNNTYIFTIMIENFNENDENEAKQLEDKIIKEIYQMDNA